MKDFIREYGWAILGGVIVGAILSYWIIHADKPEKWTVDRICNSLEGYKIYDYYNVEGYDDDTLEITFYPELLEYLEATKDRFDIFSTPNVIGGWAVSWSPDEEIINCRVRLEICEIDNSNICNDGYIVPITVERTKFVEWYGTLEDVSPGSGKR